MHDNAVTFDSSRFERLEKVGGILSLGCAVHCALLPFLLCALPTLRLAWLLFLSASQLVNRQACGHATSCCERGHS